MRETDTICARSTPSGAGGIAIVRLSGNEALAILKEITAREGFIPRRMTYCVALDERGDAIDEVMCVYLPAPRTYTREDMAEIQCHGSNTVAEKLLERCAALGARPAEPGEFTKRAFLNGRIDIAQAEAVMEMISSSGRAAARASVRQLEGGVSVFVKGCSEKIVDMLALIEATIDFPEEMEEEIVQEELIREIKGLIEEIDHRRDARSVRLLREGALIVLAGRPNVGKSSLMNALLQRERAIVTEIPGTTRDVLTERIHIGGIQAELSDTAGLRDTDDPVEKLGVERAKREAEQADIVLLVIDAGESPDPEELRQVEQSDVRTLICLNKTDKEGLRANDLRKYTQKKIWEVSARTGEGLQELLGEIERRLSGEIREDTLTVQRHLHLAGEAQGHLKRALDSLTSGIPLDVLSVHLEEALNALSEILDVNGREEVIDEIFSRFCVGK